MREARVTVDDDAFEVMGIEDLVELFRQGGVRDFDELVCEGTGAVVEVGVEDPVSTDDLDDLGCVDDWEYLGEGDGGHRYVVAFTAPDLPASLADEMDDLLGTCDPELFDGEAAMSLVGTQEAIAATIRAYEAGGVSPDLEKLGAYEGDTEPLDDLTDRQREVLRTAFDLGYYDVPRTTTTDEIAASLDLDASTVTEHLQRAERNLLANHL